MKNSKKILIISGLFVILSGLIVYFALQKHRSFQPTPSLNVNSDAADENPPVIPASPADNSGESSPKKPDIVFVGPRQGIPENAPIAYGFWSFAMPVSGILSRSGQPLIGEFQWLKDNGWKGVVDLRVDGDHNEVSDDAKIPGFNELGLNYLKIQIVDGAAPTDEQGQELLSFATDPQNQPLHVHCRGGIGRAGTMIALYRYSVQGWPMEKAIEESKLFQGGVSVAQKKWLDKWASENPPGSFHEKRG